MAAQMFRSLVILFFVLVVAFFPKSTVAYDATASSGVGVTKYADEDMSKRAELSTYGVLKALSCIVSGNWGGNSCDSITDKHSAVGAGLSGGLLGVTNNLLIQIYNQPPLSTGKYVASIGKNLNLIHPIQAQVPGSGSDVISSIFIFWQASRNIAYLGMTLMFIIIGLMILLGSKSGSQSVLTVQAALPGLVVGLILITFSYFFSAMLVDIAFVGSNLIGYLFSSILHVSQADATTILNHNNIIQMFLQFVFNLDNYGKVQNFIYVLSDSNALNRVVVVGAGTVLAGMLSGQVGSLIGGAIPGGFGTIGQIVGVTLGAPSMLVSPRGPENLLGLAVYFIISLAIIYAMVKLLVDLVKRYITILFLTIFAPLIFMVASFPGNTKGVEGWVRNMLCNVLAFPAVFGTLYFAAYFLGNGGPFQMTTSAPKIVGVLPLFGDYPISIINQIIGFGILIASPSVPEMICKMIGAKLDEVFGKEIQANTKRAYGNTMRATGELGGGGGKIREELGKAQSSQRPGAGSTT